MENIVRGGGGPRLRPTSGDRTFNDVFFFCFTTKSIGPGDDRQHRPVALAGVTPDHGPADALDPHVRAPPPPHLFSFPVIFILYRKSSKRASLLQTTPPDSKAVGVPLYQPSLPFVPANFAPVCFLTSLYLMPPSPCSTHRLT